MENTKNNNNKVLKEEEIKNTFMKQFLELGKGLFEPLREKTNDLHMRKQRRRSASR